MWVPRQGLSSAALPLITLTGMMLLGSGACSSGEPFDAVEQGGSAGSGGSGGNGKAGSAGSPTSGSGGSPTEPPSGGDDAGGAPSPSAGSGPSAGDGSGGESTLTCPVNFDDCNGKASDGCEQPLSTVEHCGDCHNVCADTTTPFCTKLTGVYVCKNPVEKLDGQRLELPCVAGVTTAELCPSVVTTDVGCTPGGHVVMRELKMSGDANVVYDVTLRVRGVLEPKVYQGGKDAGDHFYVGGEPAASNYNAFGIQVSAPAQTYFLNAAGPGGETYAVFPVDHTKVIQVAGGATVTLAISDPDCAMVRNCKVVGAACEPYVVNDIPPAPAGYEGQFVQLDVVKVTRAP